MGRPSVAQFISDKRAEGMSDSKISHLLLDAGWHMDIIHKAMHGEPIKHLARDPILDIKKQPFRKIFTYGLPIIVFFLLVLSVIYL